MTATKLLQKSLNQSESHSKVLGFKWNSENDVNSCRTVSGCRENRNKPEHSKKRADKSDVKDL